MPNHRLAIELLLIAGLGSLPAGAAAADPCAAEIDKVQAEVDARIDAIAGSGHSGAETRAARLHHQPTPASIAAAERRLHESEGTTRALAALVRARKAEADREAGACEKAVAAARAAIVR
jgi:hypothetical protein